MSVAFRKILGDWRESRGQLALLLAAILIGQAAMTAAFTARSVLAAEIGRNFAMARAPDLVVEVTGVDSAAADAVAGVPGVAAADAIGILAARYRLRDGGWRPILLYGRRDFGRLSVSRVFPAGGAWPPGPGQLLIEQSGLGILDRRPGETLDVTFGEGRELALTYAGIVHDPAQAPSWQENAIYGYTDLAGLLRAAGPRALQFHILLEPGAEAAPVAQRVAETLTARGGRIVRIDPVAATHPHADLMQGLLLLLSVFSLLSYVLALFLAGSIVAALTQRQEKQFAVLRALGASRLRIGALHLGFALVPSLLALLAGAYLGEAGAGLLERVIAAQLNLDLLDASAGGSLRLDLLIAGASGLLVVLTVPVAASVRKPIRQVLQSGLGRVGRPWFRLRFLAPLDRLAVAEAFQRPVRTTIAVAALTVAGIALLASTNMFVSLVGVVDRLAEARHDTISIGMSRHADPAALGARLRAIDGMQAFELWDRKAVMLGAEGGAAERFLMYSPPAGSRMGLPQLLSGRWPTGPGEIAISGLAVGHNASLHLALGRQVSLGADGANRPATIVGLVDEFGMSIWASPATFASLAAPEDRGREIRAIVEPGKAAPALAAAERAVIASGSYPAASSTRDDRRAAMVNHFFAFYRFLLVASLTAGIVGAAALSANIGANVLGRTREIAVLRALGARSGALSRLVLVQALTITSFSLVLAAALSLPLSAYIVAQLAQRALHLALPLIVSWRALAALGLGGLLLAALAALAPAVRISRLPIREGLAYE